MKGLTAWAVVLAICISAANGGINVYWRDFNGTIPRDAIMPADGLYIGQVPVNGMLPGTFYPKTNTLITMAKGNKIKVTDITKIKILCTTDHEMLYWEYVNVDTLVGGKLKNLIVGGFEDGSTLYIGKVHHEDQWKIGKVFPPSSRWKGINLWKNNGCCYVGKEFQILAYYY